VEDIGVHGEIKNFVVTFVVMRHFFILPDAPRACADFCDPTAVSRFKVKLPFSFRQAFNGVPQHGPGHLVSVDCKKVLKNPLILFPNLAQHPPDGFMHKVFRVLQEAAGKIQRVGEVSVFDEMKCGDNGDSPIPMSS